MANLFLTVSEALTPSLRGLVAESLGEAPESVERGARCLAGGVVAGLITAAGTPSGATGVLRAVRGMDVGLLFDASPLLDSPWRDGKGQSLLGARAEALADDVAGDVGLRPGSARALLELVEPLVLAAIARSGVASDEAGLRSFLRSVEPEATRLAPTKASAPPKAAAPAAPAALLDASPPNSRRPHPAVWLALALLVLALLLLLFISGDG